MKLLALTFFLLTLDSWSLPSSGRIFQAQHGFKVSCNLCHASGGGSAVNKYGKDFLRNGGNAAAFKKIAALDSDGDGVVNSVELGAKANPGDSKSTPAQAGDWLASASSIYIPQKELEKVFPGFSKFSAIEGSLNAKQIEFYKAKLGFEPNEDDKIPTFYFAEMDSKKVAVAQFVIEKQGDLGLNTAIALSLSGQIKNIHILGGSAQKTLAADTAYLASFVGKSVSDLPKPGASVESQLLHRSTLRNLYLVQSVFGGAAK